MSTKFSRVVTVKAMHIVQYSGAPLNDAQHPSLHAANYSLKDVAIFCDILDPKQLVKGVIVIACLRRFETESIGGNLSNGSARTPKGCCSKNLKAVESCSNCTSK